MAFSVIGRTGHAYKYSNCPLGKVLTYKNLIFLLNLQFSIDISDSPLYPTHGDSFLVTNALLRIQSVASFRNKLKSYLFTKAYLSKSACLSGCLSVCLHGASLFFCPGY